MTPIVTSGAPMEQCPGLTSSIHAIASIQRHVFSDGGTAYLGGAPGIQQELVEFERTRLLQFVGVALASGRERHVSLEGLSPLMAFFGCRSNHGFRSDDERETDALSRNCRLPPDSGLEFTPHRMCAYDPEQAFREITRRPETTASEDWRQVRS